MWIAVVFVLALSAVMSEEGGGREIPRAVNDRR